MASKNAHDHAHHDDHNHSHDHAQDHDHSCCDHGDYHGPMHVHGQTSGPMLWTSLCVTLGFVALESFYGLRAHSLALLSDAGHNFSDALALGLAAYAVWIARKPANARNTFGYHRVAILTALFNAGTLIAIAVGILVEACGRLRHPEVINGNIMLGVAAVAVLMNTVIAGVLRGDAKHNLNMRAAYIHMAGDAISAVVVIVAALVYRATHIAWLDPAVSILIALFIGYTSWGIVTEATDILLESTPKGIDVADMVTSMREVNHVEAVHDMHVWSVSSGMNFLSCHVEVEETRTMEEVEAVLCGVNALLTNRYGITHATIQTERSGSCVGHDDSDGVYCGDHLVPSRPTRN